MINTIFYFAESLSLEDYISQVQSGEISPKTIVLASELKSIYKGGRMFGKTSYEDLKSEIERMFGSDDSSLIRRYIQDLIDNRSYDDTSLRNALSEVNNSITNLSNTADSELARLTELINTFNTKALNLVETLLSDPSWVQNNLPKETPAWQLEWDNKVRAVLSTVGYWDGDGEDWSAKYSQIVQSVNSLSATVTSIQNSQYDGSFVTEVMRSEINQAINNGLASLDLGTSFTEISNDIDKTKQVIQWLYSGLRSQTSANYNTFASLYAAGSNNITNAISEIRAEVTKLLNGDYVSTSSVESAVDGAIASLYNKVTNTHASASIFSKIKNNSSAIAGLETDVQNIQDSITGINSQIATASLVTRLGGASNGLVLKSTYTTDYNALDGKITDNYNSIANLTNTVNGLSAGVLTEVQINNKISLATATLIARSELTDGTIAASVIAKVNEQGSLLKLSADRIDITGTTFALNVVTKGLRVLPTDSLQVGDFMTIGPGIRMVDGDINYNSSIHQLDLGYVSGGISGRTIYHAGSDLSDEEWYVNGGGILFGNGLSILSTGRTEYGRTLKFTGSGKDIFEFNPSISTNAIVLGDRNLLSYLGINTDKIVIGKDIDTGSILMGLNQLKFGPDNELYIKYAQGLGFMDINPGSLLYLHSDYIALNGGTIAYNITGHTTRFYFSGGIDVAGTVVDTSDIRLKENIVDVTASIEDIANARIVDFNYKDKNEIEFGAIAQDWQSIFPHAIREVSEDGMLGMNYGAIAIGSAVIAAREIVALKQRIALLEASLNQ